MISNEPEKIFNSPDFTSISEKSLITLIQNNNLQASDIQAWEHVLKWGLAQNPELPFDPASFSKEDFDALKKPYNNVFHLLNFTI